MSLWTFSYLVPLHGTKFRHHGKKTPKINAMHCSLFLILFSTTCLGSCICCAAGQMSLSHGTFSYSSYIQKWTCVYLSLHGTKIPHCGRRTPNMYVMHCSLFLILFTTTCIGSCICSAAGQNARSSLGSLERHNYPEPRIRRP